MLYKILSPILRVIGAYKLYERFLYDQIKDGPKPSHIAFILDGNRRWAREKGLSVSEGYKYGAKKAWEVLKWAYEFGIPNITLWILSVDNLKRRPQEELNEIFNLAKENLYKLADDPNIHREEVRVRIIGERNLLPKDVIEAIETVEKKTAGHSKKVLNIAIAYSGRYEILSMVKSIAQKVESKELKPEDITEEIVFSHLYTSDLPNPDLVIRTSGEQRLSDFMSLQIAYSELVFIDVPWPDFRLIDFRRAIRTYQKRERRFGK